MTTPMTTLWPYLALAAGILIGVAGQIALKTGADAGHAGLLDQFTRPTTILGFVLYGLAAIAYTIALRKLPVSIAFPSVSLSYVLVALAANRLWGEPLGWPQLAGMALIVGGIVLLHQHA